MGNMGMLSLETIENALVEHMTHAPVGHPLPGRFNIGYTDPYGNPELPHDQLEAGGKVGHDGVHRRHRRLERDVLGRGGDEAIDRGRRQRRAEGVPDVGRVGAALDAQHRAGGRWVFEFASGFLNNTGSESVRFTDPSGTAHDSYDYSLSSTQYDKVFHRIGDGGTWCTTVSTNATKGTANPATCP